MNRPRTIALLVVACVGVGLAADSTRTGVLATLAVLVVAIAVIAGGREMVLAPPTPPRSADGPAGRLITPLTVSWLAVSLLPVHNLIKRANADAVSQAGLEPLIELSYFAAVGVVAILAISRLEPTIDDARPPIFILLLPVWATASFAWSATSAYAFVRGAEMIVIATLAWATTALGRTSPAALEDLVDRFLRWFVRIVAVLVGLGVVFGPVLVPASAENLERFSWIGAHPNGSGLILAAAIVVLAAARPGSLGLTSTGRVVGIAAFALALAANQSRTALVALGVGLVATVVLRGHVRSLWHRRWTPAAALASVMVLVAARGLVADFVLRGRDSDSLLSGNGRVGLWPIGFDALRTPFDWLCGLGYGAARTVFVQEKAWATTAHNSVLSLLVSLGLVGVALLGVLVFTTGRDLHRSGSTDGSRFDVGLIAFVAVLVAGALASDAMAEPNVGLAGLFLVAAVATARRASGVADLGARDHGRAGVGR